MQHFISSYGYIGLFVIALLSSACLPVPSEVAFGLAGAYCTTAFSAHAQFSVVNVVIIGTIGSVIGSQIAYELGRFAGRAIVDRYGKYLLLSHKDLDASFSKNRVTAPIAKNYIIYRQFFHHNNRQNHI